MSGSGGGGSSDPPEYVQKTHMEWLSHGMDNDEPFDYLNHSVVESMNDALDPGANPYVGVSAYDPDEHLSEMKKLLSDYQTTAEIKVSEFNSAAIAQASKAFQEQQLDMMDSTVLPQYRARMRDIGAVTSSYYPIGEAILWRDKTREHNKFVGDMLLQEFKGVTEWERECITHLVHYGIEVERMSIAAKIDEINHGLQFRAGEGRWNLETYQYGANLLAAVTGGVVGTTNNKPSAVGSAIGGAMSGAAIGSKVNTGWGTAIGAVVGAVAGLVQRNNS